jgi:tetratricopeptide (TPR) repeat protein
MNDTCFARDLALVLGLVLALLGPGAGVPPAAAHDSPEHVIEALTARIEAGPRPDLLWRRAAEYRSLGQLQPATRDLKQALKLDPNHLPALADLSRMQLAQGSGRAALRTIEHALGLVQEDASRAPLRMVRADIFCASGNLEKALADCERALPFASGIELDWYLTRSQIQSRLGRFREAAAGLREGFERTGSAVLEVEWIDALIDGGLLGDAAPRIESFLEESRWRSSWLIRRARVRLAQGELTAGHNDLLAAIQELNQRINGLQPSVGLVADRSLAYALAGDATLARRDLAAARKLGADAGALRRIELALGGGGDSE